MREKAPAWLAGAAAATSTVSIAASQILLGAAVLSLLLNPKRLRWPPVTWPIAAFMGWTLVSLAASPDPRAGLPQIKKFYEYLMLFAVFSAVRTAREVWWTLAGIVAGAGVSALWAAGQFVRMYRGTPDFFYHVYSNGARATGFMGHWMTFSGITMMALIVAGAMLLFAGKRWITSVIPVLGVGLLVSYQRTMWAGAAVGVSLLLWWKNKWLTLIVPAAAALLMAASPLIRDRVMAIFQPQQNILDSGAHRAALRATGWEMIQAHPLTGVGPDQVKVRFLEYAPPQVPRPVPSEWSIGHLHNIYFQYAAERGLPALAALLWFLLKALTDFWRGAKTAAEGRWVLLAGVATVLAIMVAGLAEHNLNDSEVLGVFLGIVACAYSTLLAARS